MAKMKWNFSIDVIANEWEKILLIIKKAFLKVAFIQKVLMPDDMEKLPLQILFFCHTRKRGLMLVCMQKNAWERCQMAIRENMT